MRGNGQPQKRCSGVRLILSMLVIMAMAFSLAACSITIGGISLEITSIDSNGNVNATVTLSDINRAEFLSNSNNALSNISIYYAYTEAKAAELADYAGKDPGSTVSVLQTAYDGWYGVDVSPEENNAFKTDPTEPTSFSKQLSFQIPAEAEGKNIAFLVVLSGTDSTDGWGSSGDASSVIFNYTWKADPTVTAPTAKTLTYTGSAQELVNAGEATGGEMQYAIGTDDQTAPLEGWDTSIPTATDAGTYYVWYMVFGDDYHNDTAPESIEVIISPQAEPEPEVIPDPAPAPAYTPALSGTARVPSGTAHPEVTVSSTNEITPKMWAVLNDDNSVTVSWEKIKNASSYILYVEKNGKAVKLTETKGREVTLKNAKNDTTYKFSLKYTRNGSTFSAPKGYKANLRVYYKPTVTATAAKDGKILLKWNKVANADKYVIYRVNGSGKLVRAGTTSKTAARIAAKSSDTGYVVRASVNGKLTKVTKTDIVTAE